MIEASPESMRVSPHERSQNGSAVLRSPTTDEPAPVRAHLVAMSCAADGGRDDHGEHERGEADPSEDQRRGLELPHGDLDEHERAAPDQGEQQEHGQGAASHRC